MENNDPRKGLPNGSQVRFLPGPRKPVQIHRKSGEEMRNPGNCLAICLLWLIGLIIMGAYLNQVTK